MAMMVGQVLIFMVTLLKSIKIRFGHLKARKNHQRYSLMNRPKEIRQATMTMAGYAFAINLQIEMMFNQLIAEPFMF